MPTRAERTNRVAAEMAAQRAVWQAAYDARIAELPSMTHAYLAALKKVTGDAAVNFEDGPHPLSGYIEVPGPNGEASVKVFHYDPIDGVTLPRRPSALMAVYDDYDEERENCEVMVPNAAAAAAVYLDMYDDTYDSEDD